jgi:hypothetical protein
MSEKLTIANEMRQFDRKNRNFYDELTDEEKKKFSTYLMIRWGSAVQGSRDLEEYYILSTNERLNTHFFDVGKHPKLQWLMATTVSPGVEILNEHGGMPRHPWIAPKKKEAGLSAKRKALMVIYPHYKDDEIDVMAEITTQKEIDEYNRLAGNVKK